MKLKLTLAAVAALSCLGTQAADWSDTSVGYRYASQQSEPGVSHSVSKNILNLTHVSGDKLGMNFFTIDLLKSGSNDPSAGNGPSGAQEWYGFYKRSYSMQGLTGAPVTLGFAKDVNLNLRVDAGAKNTAFAPAPFKLRGGFSAAMPVSAGFWDLGVDLYKEKNHNGITGNAHNVGKDVTFDTTLALTSAWAIPVGPGTFGGFFDIVGPKGKDGFGDKTKTEVLVRGTYMVDVGGPKSGLKAGVGVEYWGNKFGCNNSTNFIANSCKSTTPMLLAEYHL